MKEAIVKGIVWMSGASLLTQVVTWVSTILIARMLNPSDYGIVAIAGTYISFADLINEFGVGTALVQTKELNNDDIKGIFTISIIIGILMTIGTYLLAPFIADFFKEEQLVLIIRFLGLSFLINGAKSVQRNLMMREMRFAELAKADSGSRILTSVGALTLAYCGFGMWVLVIQMIIQNLIMLIWSFCYERRLPGRICNMSRMKELLSFGGGVALVNVFYSAFRSFDPLIVGKLLGQVQLGYYSFGQSLADKPFEKLLSIFTQVFLPVFSKIQDDTERLKSYWVRIIEKELFVFTPIFVGLIIISPELVQVVLGNKWLGLVLPLKVFCIISLLRYLGNRINLVYVSIRIIQPQLYFVIILCLVMPVSLFVGGYYYEMNGVLAAWLLVYPLLFLVYFVIFLKFWNLPVGKFLSVFSGPFMGTCSMFISVAWLPFVNLNNPYLVLMLKITISSSAYFIITFVTNRRVVTEMLELLNLKSKISSN